MTLSYDNDLIIKSQFLNSSLLMILTEAQIELINIRTNKKLYEKNSLMAEKVR